MTAPERIPLDDRKHAEPLGSTLGRYGLVVVLVWIGVGKYVKMESRVLIEHSP